MRLPAPATVRAALRTHTGPMARALIQQWQVDRVAGLAAEVAFWSALSFFPMMLAVGAALGSIEVVAGADAAEQAREEVTAALETILTEDADDTVEEVDELFRTRSPGLLTVAVVGAVWAASRGFAAVIRALDVAYDLEEKRGYLRTRLLALAMSVGSIVVGAVILAMLVVGPLLGTGHELADRYDLGDTFVVLWNWVRWPVAFAFMVLWAATILHLGPNHTTPWRWDLPGALLTSVLWVIFSVGLRFYLLVAGGSNQLLGLLGGSLIILIWLFLLSLALVVGGEVNAILVELGIAPRPRTPGGDEARAG